MKPILSVPKKYLLLISGIMWSAVGIMLMTLATIWLRNLDTEYPVLIATAGVLPGLIVALYGFSHVVNKNIRRIENLSQRVSVFAFQAWHSYILIAVMMSMGIYIRHSGLIPMILKTPGYYTIGTALTLGSVSYYKEFFRS
jgi:hypothetical protein